MKRHRGLTLIEVLISLVLLSMMAAACLPLITRATSTLRASHEMDSSSDAFIHRAELAAIADRLNDRPADFGFEKLPVSDFTIEWPIDQGSVQASASVTSTRSGIEVRYLNSTLDIEQIESDSKTKHLWLELRCGNCAVYRWFEVPDDKSDTPAGEAGQ